MNSILSFYFGISGITPEFKPFVLFHVLRHRAWIQSLRFVSGSLTSRPDSISSFSFGFSSIAPRFEPFVFFPSSQASHPDSFPSFCFRFSSIASGFDPFLLFGVLRHRVRIQSLSFVSGSQALYLDSIP